jgi:membrane associated rhomboid family serine protease
MVIPVGDQPNPNGVPWMTYALITANVAVFLLITMPLGSMPLDVHDPRYQAYVEAVRRSLPDPALLPRVLQGASEYDLYVFAHGFRPAAMSLPALFTSMFLHGGLLHLAGNMLFLWIYGDNVEHRLGRVRYLIAYLGTGVAASLSHVLLDPSSGLPMVGASGAISGILGCYFVWFPRNRVRVLWLLPPLVMQVFLVPARTVLAFYLVLDNLLPMALGGAAGGIAHAAHIGGFVAGAAGAFLGGRWSLRGAPGDVSDADDALALAEGLRAGGESGAALAVLQRYLRTRPRDPGSADVHVAAGRILLEDLDHPTSAYQHLIAALELGPTPGAEALARNGLAAIARQQKRPLGRLRAV